MQQTEHKQKTSHGPDGKEATASKPHTEVGRAFASSGQEDGKRPKSRGERTFNWVVHGGVNFVLNSTISVFFTDWLKNYRYEQYWLPGQRAFGKAGKAVLGKIIKRDEAWFGKTAMNLTALATPGWFLLWPITKLEQNKASVVKWLDEKIDKIKAPSEQELIKREAAYKALDEEPKPTGWAMVRNRLAGWALFNILPTYLINRFALEPLVYRRDGTKHEDGSPVLIPKERGNWFEGKVGLIPDKIEGYTRIGANWLAAKYHKTDIKNPLLVLTKMQHRLDITGQEIVSCGLTSFGLKWFLDFFQRRKQKAVEHNVQAEPKEQLFSSDTIPASEGASENREEKSHTAHMKKPAATYTQRTEAPAVAGLGL